MSLRQKLRREDGELGMLSALLLLAGVLLPIMFIVVAFARIENGRLAAAQAARDAVRAAVEAPTASDAQQAADAAIARAQTQTGVTLQLQLNGTFARGAVLQAQTSAQIGLASVPFIGQLGTITVHGRAAAPVDTYRSLVGASSP
jgi:Flp pilus assembly protein TadG